MGSGAAQQHAPHTTFPANDTHTCHLTALEFRDLLWIQASSFSGLGCRETVHVSKRVLIRGEGMLGETRIDHRANCPALRIGRTCIVQALFLKHLALIVPTTDFLY